MSSPRVWFITGTSSGYGRALAEHALARGDRVVATARRPERVADLAERYPNAVLPLRLDVTDGAAITAAVDAAVRRFGHVDVLVNNAGYGLVSSAEETTDQELRSMFETHLFGPAALVRAVLPHMRERRSGAVVQMSSMGGQLAYPGFAAYAASKFALEGFSEALAAEVAPLGITVLIVEPGATRTAFFDDALRTRNEIADYAPTVGEVIKQIIQMPKNNDPGKVAAAIDEALLSDRPPLRLPFGDDAVDQIRDHLDQLATEIDHWERVSRSTSGT